MLDLGCGFPPDTTVETAARLPGWTIHGADPSMPAFVLYDADGAYATFDENASMLYCQPSSPSIDNWNALLADHEATKKRFLDIRERLGNASDATHEGPNGCQLILDPKRTYERPGLSFGVRRIGELDVSGFDIIRCFNVIYYFDDAFRERALAWFGSILDEGGILLIGGDWAFTMECR